MWVQEQNLCPLQDKQMHLATEPSLQAPNPGFFTNIGMSQAWLSGSLASKDHLLRPCILHGEPKQAEPQSPHGKAAGKERCLLGHRPQGLTSGNRVHILSKGLSPFPAPCPTQYSWPSSQSQNRQAEPGWPSQDPVSLPGSWRPAWN